MLQAFKEDEEDSQEEAEEEKEEEDEGADDAENEVRDRSKSNRFFTMLNAGGLPEAVLSAWQNAGTRKKQTAIINGVFLKQGGKLIIDPNFLAASTYQKDRSTERIDSAADSQSGFGRLIFCKQNNLTEEELEECVRTGEVRKFKSGNIWLYSAVNVKIQSEVKKAVKETLGGQVVELEEDAGAAFAAVFDKMTPEVILPQTPMLPSSSASGHSGGGSNQSLEAI